MSAGAKEVLCIDDDAKLLELLTTYLTRHGYQVTGAGTPELGLALFQKHKPDLVICDVMLPGRSGFEVVKDLRRISDVPVIMLTARGEVTDRVVGLELGADDYLGKPFEPRELLARIDAVLRRSAARPERERLAFGKLLVDLAGRSAEVDGAAVELSTAEFEALAVFAQNPGRAFTREQLMDRLKGADWAAFDRSIDVLVSRLRGKLGDDPKQPRFIKTIWGTGYMFVAKPGRGDA